MRATMMRRARRSVGLCLVAMAAGVGAPTMGAAQEAVDPPGGAPGYDLARPDKSDALLSLFASAQDGAGDPHLPFVLTRLKQALADQDLIGFLDLVDPSHFHGQLALVAPPDRSPGEGLNQYACEFFGICDISKRYRFNDIVSMQVLSVGPAGFEPTALREVRLELRMWDGVTVVSVIFFDPATARLSSGVG